MRTGKTATEVAGELCVAISTVTRTAKLLKVGRKYGTAFMLTQKDVAAIKKRLQENTMKRWGLGLQNDLHTDKIPT